MPLLIDTSNNNPDCEWKKVKAAGISGVYLKATEGLHFTDATFAARHKEATAAGLAVGAYHFARPDDSAAAIQAKYFCDTVKALGKTDLRPALDLEVPTKLAPAALVAWARAFNNEVSKLLHCLPIFYSYSPYITAMKPAVPIGAGLWLAAYGRNDGKEYPVSVPAPWKKTVMHQFTSAGRVPGVQGVVDISHAASMTPLLAHPPKPTVVAKVAAKIPYLGKH